MSHDADFQQLLDRVRQGDEQAVEELVKTYEDDVRMVARVRLGPALKPYLDTVDLVQSVHRSVMVGLRDDKFDLTSSDHLVALALTIVQRKVARQWRKLRRQQRLSTHDTQDNLLELLVPLSAPQDDPSDLAEVREGIQALLAEAPGEQRRVLELRLAGYSTADAARHLGQNPDVTRVQLSRLRTRLREKGLLDQWLED